jgi:hypothetical protein
MSQPNVNTIVATHAVNAMMKVSLFYIFNSIIYNNKGFIMGYMANRYLESGYASTVK